MLNVFFYKINVHLNTSESMGRTGISWKEGKSKLHILPRVYFLKVEIYRSTVSTDDFHTQSISPKIPTYNLILQNLLSSNQFLFAPYT